MHIAFTSIHHQISTSNEKLVDIRLIPMFYSKFGSYRLSTNQGLCIILKAIIFYSKIVGLLLRATRLDYQESSTG